MKRTNLLTVYSDMISLSLQHQQMMLSGWQVIWWRMFAMGTGTMTPTQFAAMISEKPLAFSRSARDAASAAARGRSPAQIASAALKPIAAKTRSNARKRR